MSKLHDYNDSTLKLFAKTFNYKGNTIDEEDKKTINDAKSGKSSNCVDWGQVYYRSATS